MSNRPFNREVLSRCLNENNSDFSPFQFLFGKYGSAATDRNATIRPGIAPPIFYTGALRNVINHILDPGSRNASQDGGLRARAFTHERAGRAVAHAHRKLRRRRRNRGGQGERACAPFAEPRGDSSPG